MDNKRRVIGQGELPSEVVSVIQDAPGGPYSTIESIPYEVLLGKILPRVNPFRAMSIWRGSWHLFGGESDDSKWLWKKYLEKSRLFEPMKYVVDQIVGREERIANVKERSKHIFLWLFYWSRRWIRTRLQAQRVTPINVMDIELGGPNATKMDFDGVLKPIFVPGFRDRYSGLPPGTQGLSQLQDILRYTQFIGSEKFRATEDLDLYNNLNDPIDMANRHMTEWKLNYLTNPTTPMVDWDVPAAYLGADDDQMYRNRIQGVFKEAKRFRKSFLHLKNMAWMAWMHLLNNYPRNKDPNMRLDIINVGCKMCTEDHPQHRCSNCDTALCGQNCFNIHRCNF